MCMPYEMCRDFSHPVSFHVKLSVSVAALLLPTPMSMKLQYYLNELLNYMI